MTATLLAGVDSCSLMYAIDLNMGSSVTLDSWNLISDSPEEVLL